MAEQRCFVWQYHCICRCEAFDVCMLKAMTGIYPHVRERLSIEFYSVDFKGTIPAFAGE